MRTLLFCLIFGLISCVPTLPPVPKNNATADSQKKNGKDSLKSAKSAEPAEPSFCLALAGFSLEMKGVSATDSDTTSKDTIWIAPDFSGYPPAGRLLRLNIDQLPGDSLIVEQRVSTALHIWSMGPDSRLSDWNPWYSERVRIPYDPLLDGFCLQAYDDSALATLYPKYKPRAIISAYLGIVGWRLSNPDSTNYPQGALAVQGREVERMLKNNREIVETASAEISCLYLDIFSCNPLKKKKVLVFVYPLWG